MYLTNTIQLVSVFRTRENNLERERFFKGRSERNDRDSMMDRKEENKLITGLSAEGLYSGHSGVCIE